MNLVNSKCRRVSTFKMLSMQSPFATRQQIQCLYIFVIPVKNISSHHIDIIHILKMKNILRVRSLMLNFENIFFLFSDIKEKKGDIYDNIEA